MVISPRGRSAARRTKGTAMTYYNDALACDITEDEAVAMNPAVEPLWRVRAADALLSCLDVAPWPVMSRRMVQRERLAANFWERKYAGEALA
nr:MAG TPA: hypothetical protein [Caudoviricetes sp.]